MRIFIPLFICFLFFACGGEHTPPDVKTDSVAPVDSSVFGETWSNVAQLSLPRRVGTDNIAQYDGYKLDSAKAYALLPGEFDYGSYLDVYCFAKSNINGMPVLWFYLLTEADEEHSAIYSDLLMVIYDQNNRPVDVCNIAHASLSLSYSYVRPDSLFTIHVDRMENINVTTTAIAITQKGFVPRPSETVTFAYGEKGSEETDAYVKKYLADHAGR